ncbi:MAG: bifunctional nicotinamidase/pyrazinamidase, partial [Candidatus Melainabacteria bacterium]|nr:bifunctional nicotinamidase/pyrazinamidase [Candidatus Melainabacteria bacterium]
LGIPNADEIVPVINNLMKKFPIIVATQDWHPKDHISFASSHPGKKPGDVIKVSGEDQVLWPAHCVHGTHGADFYPTLETAPIVGKFFKGTDQAVDSYSAFFDNARRKATGLTTFLKNNHIDTVYFAGVATDYCVLYSVLDAIEEGFSVYMIADACCAINLKPKDEAHALAMMAARGVKSVLSKDI